MMRVPMRRLKVVVVLALAVVLSAQLVLHNHALFHERLAPPCAICAFGADSTVAAPVVAAPLVVAFALAGAEVHFVAASPVRTLPPRAPPRA
jgi:hypothetical protein